jgi:Glycosyltransferase family 9 (heptosyltransferase)
MSSPPVPERLGLILGCRGIGDCLFAMAVMRKMHASLQGRCSFDLFTHQPELFRACPWVAAARPIDDAAIRAYPHPKRVMFELDKLPHWAMDTFDFVSVPLGIGTLSYREKRLQYFPSEPDTAQAFDVVLNTSMTWISRSWPLERWQRLADVLRARGLSVAVVGKDVENPSDAMTKRSPALSGVVNLANALTLDQTYFTIRKAGLFVSCQNGLSVLAGATDTAIVVLDMSIEWSKRAIYRDDSPFHDVTYVKGGCTIYCGTANKCPLPDPADHFKCVPSYEAAEAAVLARLDA